MCKNNGDMENEVKEVKKENKILEFFMQTLNGMAIGLFATLIIGTIFGAIGYFMRKNDMVTAPIVLALVLGPMAERRLLQARIAARSKPLLLYFASRPICLIITGLIIIAI